MINWIHRFKKTGFAVAFCALCMSWTSAQEALVLDGPNMDDVVENFIARDMEMEGILDKLAELTGRAILRPQALPTPKITFDPGGPITRGELILAFESLLSLNGIGISPMGERFLKIVPLQGISREAPELVTESLADRDPSGQVVSKLFRLQYLDSQSFQQQIQPFLSSGFSSIIPFQNSNAVIVTDTVSNLQRLEYVVSQVDKPSKLNIETVFYSLKYAQASEVAQQMQSMIDDARARFGDPNKPNGQGQSQGGAAAKAPAAEPSGKGASGQLSAQVLFGSNTAITSDDRTNQLIIITEPGNLSFFEEIIEKLDIQADPSTRIDVIPLKHADATEVASLLSQFVSGKTGDTGSDRSTADSNTDNNRQPRNTFENSEPRVPANNRAPTSKVVSSLSGEERSSQFSSFMTIVADERSNSLVISGTRSDLDLIGILIADIDTLLPQVRIEVIIAEVTLGKKINRGMDAFNIDYILDPVTGISTLVSNKLNFLGVNVDGTVSNDKGRRTLLDLKTVFNRARDNSDVKILSVPTIMTTHNKEASLISGESRPLITGTQSGGTFGNRSTVQYRDVGIELVVTPLIGPNNVIQMEIDQKIDDIVGVVPIDGNEQPLIGRRQTTSYVSVKSGEVVVLGGLQKEKVDYGRTRMSLLGEIPLLGRLFRKRSDKVERSELLVFIRPTVVRTTDDVNADAQRTVGQHIISEKIERFLETGSVFSEPSKKGKPGKSGKPGSRAKGSRKE